MLYKLFKNKRQQQNKKRLVDDSCLFESPCSRTVTETVKKGVFGIKQKK